MPDRAIRPRRHTAGPFNTSDEAALLVGVPHRRVTRRHGRPMPMCSRGVLVHYLSRLSTTTAVLAAEIPCGNGVFTEWAFEK